MTLSDQQILFAHDVAKLIQYAQSLGYGLTFGEAYRPKEQAELYAKQGKGIVNSLHCERLAIDMNLYVGGSYISDSGHEAFKKLGEYWESLSPSNRNGRNFPRPDANHFERRKL